MILISFWAFPPVELPGMAPSEPQISSGPTTQVPPSSHPARARAWQQLQPKPTHLILDNKAAILQNHIWQLVGPNLRVHVDMTAQLVDPPSYGSGRPGTVWVDGRMILEASSALF
ncbi:uncharacterized protein JN550_008304 [Neoarthrinium moseri]|uniref:uncharacterized protein n=1 Tax=Neoarthrinium moseri TaxID=1658444 RepID=UPI001FDE8E6D|nr:uncharacterized protein JN550_008304 [Neoarthrinium moseri]KAI1865547.1 hypothetical protein JN550_008304 [Neoarthrinium moseri]